MSFLRLRVILFLISLLGSNAQAMDLSVLREGFQNIQPQIPAESFGPQFKSMKPQDEREMELQKFFPREYFRLDYYPRHQGPLTTMMEEIFQRVVNTKLGTEICQEATLGRYEVLTFVFGVSTRTAKTVQGCLRTDSELPTIWLKGKTTPRRYSFVLYTGNRLKAQSWTTGSGTTFFFLRPEDINQETLLRLYTHELAMYLLGPSVSRDGLSDSAIYSFHRPWMRLAMNLARAYLVEAQILKELGIAIEETKLTCSQQMERAYFEILPFSSVISADEKEYHESYKSLLTESERRWDSRPWSLALKLMAEQPALCEQAMRFSFNNVTDGRGPRGPRPGTQLGTGGTGNEADRPNTHAGSGGPEGKLEMPGRAEVKQGMDFNFNTKAKPNLPKTGADMKNLDPSAKEEKQVFTKKLIEALDSDDKSGDGK
jgi:hypothetical protein